MFTIRYRDSYLELKDGVKLVSRIWIPEGEGPWPALLMRQPYGREIASTITYAHPTWWASKGYLVIIQDVRGQGGSQGVFKGFMQEAQDTSETHEWVRSLKECNGKLGLYGFSYQGLTQLTGTKDSSPPDCLTPSMTGLDIKNHWCSDGGAFWWHNNIAWALQLAALKMRRNNNVQGWNDIKSSLDDNKYLRDGLNLLLKYDPDSFIINWLNNINKNKKFEKIEPISSWLVKPMLILGGLWDPHLRGALDLYHRSKSLGGDPEIIVGNSTHLNWWKESQFDLLNFFEKHLKNSNDHKLSLIKNKKVWNISSHTWDNIENKSLNYEFGFQSNGSANFQIEDGSLLISEKGNGFVSIVHDPWRPVPIDGGHLGKNPGIFNRNHIDKRLDVAVFQTHHLKGNIHISGIPSLETSIVCDHESFDICLAISLVNEEKDVIKQFSTGFLRVNKAPINNEKKHVIEFHPTNITLKKGNKLRISLAASAWPAIGVNCGFGNENFGQTTIEHKIINLHFNLNKTIMKINSFFK